MGKKKFLVSKLLMLIKIFFCSSLYIDNDILAIYSVSLLNEPIGNTWKDYRELQKSVRFRANPFYTPTSNAQLPAVARWIRKVARILDRSIQEEEEAKEEGERSAFSPPRQSEPCKFPPSNPPTFLINR